MDGKHENVDVGLAVSTTLHAIATMGVGTPAN
jgi:hypothetical protein